MYEIAEPVTRWLADGRAVHLAQVVATRGFSSRDPGAALAWTDDGESAGSLFPTLDAELVSSRDSLDATLTDRSVSDEDATAAGLSCGGVATVLVQSASALPAELWDRLERHDPLCLVTVVDGGHAAVTEVFTPADVRDAVRIDGAHGVPRLFARGESATALEIDGTRRVAATTLWPARTLLVVGEGTIAAALADAGTLLGWTTRVAGDLDSALEVAGQLSAADAAVVLSHDRAVDVPTIAALLAGPAGYVGALGSRGTQAARRDGLTALGVDDERLARVHGPAGLDIDAHTPAEIAVSIVAEILASRAGSSGGSIRDRSGPVHTAGVHAPPPRG